MWLLDTNALIECSKQKINPFESDVTFTTILSLIEYPVASKFKGLTIIFLNSEHYKQALNYSVLLRKKGTLIPAIDILIGVIAVEKNLILISEDSHFEYFKKVEPRLKIINFKDFIEKIE